jgi:hypothetical protein
MTIFLEFLRYQYESWSRTRAAARREVTPVQPARPAVGTDVARRAPPEAAAAEGSRAA